MRPHPFFGKPTFRDREQELIQHILFKYQLESASIELKMKIYTELMEAKKQGAITIPFKVILRKDPTGAHRAHVEVILDTKV